MTFGGYIVGKKFVSLIISKDNLLIGPSSLLTLNDWRLLSDALRRGAGEEGGRGYQVLSYIAQHLIGTHCPKRRS